MSRANVLYSLLKDVFFLLDDGDRHLLSGYDLTVSRFYLLYHLGEQPGLSVSELSEVMFCDKSNVTRLLQGLEAEGLVERRPHPTDGRALKLFLTEAGRAKRTHVWEAHHKHNHRRFDSSLEEGEQRALLAYLEQLKHKLQQDLASGG